VIWVDGFGTLFGGLRQFRACLVNSKSLWLVIMPKSKDRFVERAPMKKYNHEPIWVRLGVVCGRT
jgi:hypothetical protein